MSVHISAKAGDIAPVVLMPGDPLRAKFMAETYLENFSLVNTTRNMFMYTGSYKNKRLSIAASGMGCPSIGIYSFELYRDYHVDCIIRVGTCGAYRADIKLFEVVNATSAYSESSYAKTAFDFEEDQFEAQGEAVNIIRSTAQEIDIPLINTAVHSSDVFYSTRQGLPLIVEKYKLAVVEMEAFALFANARVLKKSAATLLTVSDNIINRQVISAEEREKSLDKMARLALESVARM